MATKFVKDLVLGDRVTLEGGVGVITRVERSQIFQAKMGGAYEVEWKEEGSKDTGRAIQSGMDQIETVQS